MLMPTWCLKDGRPAQTLSVSRRFVLFLFWFKSVDYKHLRSQLCA